MEAFVELATQLGLEQSWGNVAAAAAAPAAEASASKAPPMLKPTGGIKKKKKRTKKKKKQTGEESTKNQSIEACCIASKPGVEVGVSNLLETENAADDPKTIGVSPRKKKKMKMKNRTAPRVDDEGMDKAGRSEAKSTAVTIPRQSRKRKLVASKTQSLWRPAKVARHSDKEAFVAFVQANKDSTPLSLFPVVLHAHEQGTYLIHPSPGAAGTAIGAANACVVSKPALAICTQEHGKEDIDSTWPWNVFTDGSLIVSAQDQTARAGYGVYYVWCSGGCGLAKRVKDKSMISYDVATYTGESRRILELHNCESSALTMELLAILEGLLLVQSFWGYSRLYLYTDSLPSLKLLIEYQCRPWYFERHPQKELLAAIVGVARSSYIENIFLYKVKAHTGIFGNEAADRLAKIGANLLPGSFCKFNLSSFAQPGALHPGLVFSAAAATVPEFPPGPADALGPPLVAESQTFLSCNTAGAVACSKRALCTQTF